MDLKDQRSNLRQHSFSMHPLRIFIFLIIGGISTLFLSLTLAYAYARFENGISAITVPWIFYANSANLLLASLTISLTRKAFLDDEFVRSQRLLLATLLLSLLFLGIQVLGWQRLFSINEELVANARSYLYMISGLHFLHVLVGLPFLLRFYRKSRKSAGDDVERLLYLSDDKIEATLSTIIVYWHFLDVLWIYLLVFFTVNAIF